MVFSSTVLAIALGLAPVPDGQVVQIDGGAFAKELGHYTERTDRRGVRHLRGVDRRGRAYEATIDTKGRVDATVGERVIEFTVADAG